jgi:hypothetical protein
VRGYLQRLVLRGAGTPAGPGAAGRTDHAIPERTSEVAASLPQRRSHSAAPGEKHASHAPLRAREALALSGTGGSKGPPPERDAASAFGRPGVNMLAPETSSAAKPQTPEMLVPRHSEVTVGHIVGTAQSSPQTPSGGRLTDAKPIEVADPPFPGKGENAERAPASRLAEPQPPPIIPRVARVEERASRPSQQGQQETAGSDETVSIGRISIDLVPSPVPARPTVDRTRGFQSYSRARRGLRR